MTLLQLFVLLEDELFQEVDDLAELVVLEGSGLLAGGEDDEAVLLKGDEEAYKLEGFDVELRLVHVGYDLLIVHHPLVGRGDNSYQEVQHYNKHEESLEEPAKPNQSNIDALKV